MTMRLLSMSVAATSFVLAAPALADTAGGSIPLCPGLTIVTAISQVHGDYESIKTIESVDASSVRLKYASEAAMKETPGSATKIRRLNITRVMKPTDLRTSTAYLQQYSTEAPASIPGTTAIGVSSAVLKDLKTKGEAEINIFDLPPGPLSADPNNHPSVFDYTLKGKIRRVEEAPVAIAIIVNGEKRSLPAIHATGSFFGEKAEFYFLDDAANPLALRFRLGIGAKKEADGSKSDRDTLTVVKIAYDCATSTSMENALESALEKTGRVDIHSIYFSFNSDQIRPQSKPTLQEIADILKRHPDWKLAIEGHTDSIGSDQSNQDLSSRRSAAVKTALTSDYEIDEARLTTSGHGESAPKDTNETPEGRAHNRRVELVRQ